MPFQFKAPCVALSIVAAVTVVTPGRAQEDPPAAKQEQAPDAKPQDGVAPRGPVAKLPAVPAHPRAARSAAVTATVNLRSGPGTDQEIITTIPAGSTVQIDNCAGEWCAVTWNGQSGYAIARNLSTGAPRQAGPYRMQPRYAEGDELGPPVVYGAPGYYGPPAVVYGPAYYGPRVYYGWGWRRRGWW